MCSKQLREGMPFYAARAGLEKLKVVEKGRMPLVVGRTMNVYRQLKKLQICLTIGSVTGPRVGVDLKEGCNLNLQMISC